MSPSRIGKQQIGSEKIICLAKTLLEQRVQNSRRSQTKDGMEKIQDLTDKTSNRSQRKRTEKDGMIVVSPDNNLISFSVVWHRMGTVSSRGSHGGHRSG